MATRDIDIILESAIKIKEKIESSILDSNMLAINLRQFSDFLSGSHYFSIDNKNYINALSECCFMISDELQQNFEAIKKIIQNIKNISILFDN